jgi:hypothetical protein
MGANASTVLLRCEQQPPLQRSRHMRQAHMQAATHAVLGRFGSGGVGGLGGTPGLPCLCAVRGIQ